jgi:Cd2+/Zn2+-exporting ATPase
MASAAGTELASPGRPAGAIGSSTLAREASGRVSDGLGRWLLSAKGELYSAIAAGALLLIGLVLTRADATATAGRGLYWLSLAIGMFHGGRAAIDALRARKIDIDVLMVVGAGLAAWVGAPGEGALLLFLFVLSGALEALAMARTTRAVEALHKLMPTRAMKLAGDSWVEVAPESLVAGDRVKILPGELVPTDAEVVSGSSDINQASLTGESVPRSVEPGDEVYAGTINVGNPFEARVMRPARESSLQRILNLVIEAQKQRQPVQRAIDRISEPYALGVMAASLMVLIVWWQVFRVPLVSENGRGAMYTAITLLIVMSPCALIISTPTATLTAIARAARGGVLLKGGQAIERLARVQAVAFDKTGTLTVGRMRVQQLHPVAWSSGDELLAVGAALEEESTHPIAAAVREAARQRGLSQRRVENGRFTPGRGVSGMIDGKEARLGTLVFTEDLIPVCFRARVREVLEGVQERGQIGATVAWNDHAGVIVLADQIRPGAPELVARLHDLGVRPVVMLTGDNSATARHVAESLGLDQWHAELLPQDKVESVKSLKNAEKQGAGRRRAVGVIGDGVNDAPALAAADVSIAIGSIGSDAALESADIVLLSDDLSVVPWALRLARRARAVILANLTLSLSAIAAMAVATLVGSRTGHEFPLWAGVLGHEGGTLLVVTNSLMLLAFPGAGARVLGRKEAEQGAPGTEAPQVAAAAG